MVVPTDAKPQWRPVTALAAILFGVCLASTAAAHEDPSKEPSASASSVDRPSMMMGGPSNHMMDQTQHAMPGMRNLVMPAMDPARGRKLFASKGCVACHSVNGVGGHDATALDADTMSPTMHPFELAAKMWRMAPAMIAAQEEALGYQIEFSGHELADINAFLHHREEQHRFSEDDISPDIRHMMHHTH